MSSRSRPGFTLFQLLVLLVILALLLALLLPAIAKARAAALRQQKLNNLKQIGLACHNFHDAYKHFPPGNDANNFSAAAKLLPFVEQDNLFNQIKLDKPITDDANAAIRKMPVPVFLSPNDPVMSVDEKYGATNYLFNAGSKPSLEKNDGVFFQDSKLKLAAIADGTSVTIMAGETLKGDGGAKAVDVRRQYVLLDKDALKDLKDEAGVAEWKDGKNIAGDRGASWMDGRFLQGTFTGTRAPNDERPDVNCAGLGGLSALRSLDDLVSTVFCDGSARTINAKKIKHDVWKLLTSRDDGMVIPFDF
jgi:type II secretory pathway pseudopilin PulG